MTCWVLVVKEKSVPYLKVQLANIKGKASIFGNVINVWFAMGLEMAVIDKHHFLSNCCMCLLVHGQCNLVLLL